MLIIIIKGIELNVKHLKTTRARTPRSPVTPI
jgi:hypothetical protein